MKSITYDDLHDAETRVTDEKSGGQKGKKLTQLGALDPVALIEVSRVAGFGANKYAAFNFLKGYDWSLSFNAGMRHALLFWAREDRDGESGQLHAAMAAWHFLTLVSFLTRGVGNDDRPPALVEGPELAGITREALEGLVSQVPGLTLDWNGGDPVVTQDELCVCHDPGIPVGEKHVAATDGNEADELDAQVQVALDDFTRSGLAMADRFIENVLAEGTFAGIPVHPEPPCPWVQTGEHSEACLATSYDHDDDVNPS